MKFGSAPLGEAEGAILAHSIRHPGGTIKKGTVLTKGALDALAKADLDEVLVVRLDDEDVHEDEAAKRLARAVAGASVRVDKPFTGRANLYAEVAGVLTVDKDLIDRLNRIDPALTVATLPAFSVVEAGRMVATVKVIPFAAPRKALDLAVAAIGGGSAIAVAGYRPLKVGLVATTLPTLKPSVMDKTRRLIDERLAPAGASVSEERRVPHNAAAVGEALADLRKADNDLLVVFGASAMVDPHDVVPAGIEAAGGMIDHLGMPVDPGNLLVLGKIGSIPVVGAPGCARSPKENGFDWVLNRLLAGLDVTPEDITSLGVGGLLMEIVSRPQPREGGAAPPTEVDAPPKIAALVLAAGQGRRMGGPNKLLANVGGKALVRRAAEAALNSKACEVTVVTGHRAQEVRSAIEGLAVTVVNNPAHAEGLSTSLRTGVESLSADIDGAIVLLADMPEIDSATIDRLIDAFKPNEGAFIVVPTCQGKRGNPVVWSSRFFPALAAVHGDTGGRHLIGENPEIVVEVEIGESVAIDVDTPEALAAVGGTLPND